MVRIYAHTVLFEVKGKLTEFHMFQFILVQIRPSPYTGVDDMWEAFTTCYLLTGNKTICKLSFYYNYTRVDKIQTWHSSKKIICRMNFKNLIFSSSREKKCQSKPKAIKTNTMANSSGNIPAQKIQRNSVPGAVFSYIIPKMRKCTLKW